MAHAKPKTRTKTSLIPMFRLARQLSELPHTVKVCGFTKKIFYKTYKESRLLPAFFFLQKGQIYRKNFHI